MQRYINQLIEDLRASAEIVVDDIDFSRSPEEVLFRMLESARSKTKPAKEVVGVSYEELPPAESLTDKQADDLKSGIILALEAKNYKIRFPNEVSAPVKVQYEALRDEFKKGFYTTPGSVIDFCIGRKCRNCRFADYCEFIK